MADNIVLNLGSGGDTLAADDISGIKYSRSKITLGAEGVNDGDVSSSNPMPVGVAPKSTFVGNGIVQVGVSSVQLTSCAATKGVIIKALAGNTGKIYLGKDTNVTTTGATGGFELSPGDSVTLPLTNTNLVWCISDTAAQYVSYAVV